MFDNGSASSFRVVGGGLIFLSIVNGELSVLALPEMAVVDVVSG